MKKIKYFVFYTHLLFAKLGLCAIVSINAPSDSQFFCKSRFKDFKTYSQCIHILTNKHLEVEVIKILDQPYGDRFLSDLSKIEILNAFTDTKEHKRPSAYFQLLNSFTEEHLVVEAANRISKLPILSEQSAKLFVEKIVSTSNTPKERLEKIKTIKY